MVYGTIGHFQQLVFAPSQGQIPLGFGFTWATDGAKDVEDYVIGVPGQDQGFQLSPQLAGQEFIAGLPLRSHTTGIIDWAVRHGLPGAEFADELVHPGRASALLAERPDNPQSPTFPGNVLRVFPHTGGAFSNNVAEGVDYGSES